MAALLLGLLAWWLLRPEAPAPPDVSAPIARPAPPPAPPARRTRTYALKPTDDTLRPEPMPAPDVDVPGVPLEREAAFDLVRAGDRAMGEGFRTCVRPTLTEDAWDLPPLVLNLVVHDGVVVDLELTSPIELSPDLLACFADAAWATEFPESPGHAGETRIQRTMGLKR